ncbi:DUF1707 domain-containing protein [Saccharopolyspora sp. MS10]|uniref:DUF1707 SHOCT-like domain-containing protein n=1 Tax=Saccharopolyspora sp. MS10 TaxID=3385973 RepID=UPI0039A15E0B
MRARDRDLRIGDAERETAINRLGEHLTAGRLDVVEYDERCATAAGARSRAELDALFADLPGARPDRSRKRVPRGEVLFGLAGAALLLVLVALTRDLWLLGFLAVFGVAWVLRRR